jgi:hypothetical protein
MPIYSSQIENPVFKDWSIYSLEKHILEMLDHPCVYAVSTTWLPLEKVEEISQWALADPSRHAVFLSMMDPCFIKLRQHPRIHYVGTEHVIYFALLAQQYFKDYTAEQIGPVLPFKNKFLCYQRKPNVQRQYLYELLEHRPGIVTLSHTKQFDFNSGVVKHRGFDEVICHEESSETMMPHDLWTVGNIDVWRSSFLNIVSETAQHVWQSDRTFISEKTFKPILGMRPFIHYGEGEFGRILKARGFETFDEDFGYDPYCKDYSEQADQITRIIDHLDNPESLYQKLLPKLEHNRNHMQNMVDAEWQQLRNIIADFHSMVT